MNYFQREELRTLYKIVFLHITETSSRYHRKLSESVRREFPSDFLVFYHVATISTTTS